MQQPKQTKPFLPYNNSNQKYWYQKEQAYRKQHSYGAAVVNSNPASQSIFIDLVNHGIVLVSL